MNTRAVVVQNWPQPDTVSSAVIVMEGSRLVVGYGTGHERYAVITFPWTSGVRALGLNDETLHGHPLYAFGLKHYSIHRVEESSWLRELERQNSVHDLHDARRFLRDKVHYIFALKEQTVECIVIEREGTSARVEVFPSQQSALVSIGGGIGA